MSELCLPASPGGHLEQLRLLLPAVGDLPHVFITPPSPQAEALRAQGHRVVSISDPHRNPAKLARNCARAAWLVLRERPRVVVSCGGGLTIPFCLAAKSLGARLIYIETIAQVDDLSLSGRIAYPFADHFFVQWPGSASRYPRAQLCRPLLLEQIGARGAHPREGTFVATGNHNQPFDRLLRMVDEAAARGLLPEPVVAQVGRSATYRPRCARVAETFPPAEMRRLAHGSRLMIVHAGAGLISLALRCGLRPLVLARRREHREHVNDHQVAMAARLASLGLVLSLDEVPLEQALERAAEPPASAAELPGAALLERVRELVHDLA